MPVLLYRHDQRATKYVVHGKYLSTNDSLPEASSQRHVLPDGDFFTISESSDDTRISPINNYHNLRDWIAQVGD